jgi:uncharacterized membrane protein
MESPSAPPTADRRDATRPATAKPPKTPGFLMGVGLGGFVDGIVLHQILQWHHLLTDEGDFPANTVQGLEDNMLADGIFHVATWVFVAVGMLVTVDAWRRGKLAPPWRSHIGMLLAGWGAFNLVEGIVDHQILGIHHVRDDLGGPLSWDVGFLVFGALLVLAGLALSRSGDKAVEATAAVPGERPRARDRSTRRA